MSVLDGWRRQAPQPAPLPAEQSHFFVSYAAAQHAWAVRWHDMLSSLNFPQDPPPPHTYRVEMAPYRLVDWKAELNDIHARPAWNQGRYKILVWSQQEGGQADSVVQEAAALVRSAGYQGVILIGAGGRAKEGFEAVSLHPLVSDYRGVSAHRSHPRLLSAWGAGWRWLGRVCVGGAGAAALGAAALFAVGTVAAFFGAVGAD